jgi:glucosamine--fructose-6-phosphate aminotransferase (isomerizing)
MSGELMAAEIHQQPEVFRRILSSGRPEIERVADSIRAREPRFVLFAARGTSDHAALYAKYLAETLLGMPAGLISPSTMTVYGARPRLQGGLFIAVSQSGKSPDLIEPLIRARESGAMTLAVTNAPDSPLAREAELSLDVMAESERAVAATKTYTAELLTLYLLLAGLDHGVDPAVEQLPDLAEHVLGDEDAVGRVAARYRFAEQMVITARGYNYPTAQEGALKLMETSYLVAHAFSGADLLHGPMAMIDRGFPVIAVAPAGAGSEALRPVLERLQELGADTLLVGEPELASFATVCLPLAEPCPEVLSPLLAILPLQQLAWHLARERGQDPDSPRAISKVTETW